jgi:hypothetical protein
MTCSYSNGLCGFSIRPSGKRETAFVLKLKKGSHIWRIDNVDTALEIALSRNTGFPEWDGVDLHVPPEIFNLAPWPTPRITLQRGHAA